VTDSGAKVKYPCVYCKADSHRIYKCESFKNLDDDKKWSFVTKNKLCISCLGTKHSIRDCKFKKIDNCEKSHNRLLHKSQSVADVPKEDKTSTTVVQEKNCHVNEKTNKVLLKVVPILVMGKTKSINTFALLDDASTVSLIDQDLANELELEGPVEPLNMQWTNDQTNEQNDSRVVSLRVKGTFSGAKTYLLRRVRTLQGLQLPRQTVNESMLDSWPYLKDVSELTTETSEPKLLIGQDNWPVIVSRDMKY